MEPALARPRHEAIDDDDLLVHEWRVTRLTRLGIPWLLTQEQCEMPDVRHASRGSGRQTAANAELPKTGLRINGEKA